MRLDTHRISVYLVNLLQASRNVREILHDGGDIITLRLTTGERVSIHLIERVISLHELRLILSDNDADGFYTLFILWADMLLPSEGRRWVSEDWLAALLALYGDRVFAFEVFSPTETYLFPVYFDGSTVERTVRYGSAIGGAIGGALLVCQTVMTVGYTFSGDWRVASFEVAARRTYEPPLVPRTRVQKYYDALGLEEGAGRLAVKMTYRRLARLYHPDLSRAPDATARMQAINEAYAALMDIFDEGDSGDA
jgi:hypothetical protein